jgi:hypothetical protein
LGTKALVVLRPMIELPQADFPLGPAQKAAKVREPPAACWLPARELRLLQRVLEPLELEQEPPESRERKRIESLQQVARWHSPRAPK